MKTQCFALVFSVLLGAADGPREEAVRQEIQKLQGTWAAASLVRDGADLPDVLVKQFKLVVKGDEYRFGFGQPDVEGAFRIEPTREPKEIDSRAGVGANKGNVYPGIYDLDGDTLKVCFAAAGRERPKEFASKPGSMSFVAVLKRQRR
jgi:uncharacterized protein (TIGR03067 family)